ncbi:MAG TPA: ComF family protein [Niabella sp.]|nr:ComF family protein [Niabella sp.]HRO84784.1 ComF family protein [Niabella sp.]
MKFFSAIKESLLHLLYPHVCEGCGNDGLSPDSRLCVRCIHDLPVTGFEKHAFNPVEKMLTGRIQFEKATAQFYFTKEGLMQTLMHRFKYKGNSDLGKQLGVLMGMQLSESNRFDDIDVLVPLPLFENKERQRGYNQSTVLCKGIAEVMQLPIIEDAVIRPMHTDTQTKKSRIERWKNMEGKFQLVDGSKISGKHILLVDDVITTGATGESCATALLEEANVKVSIAALCMASYV